jgi:hypothetical protein
MTDLVTTDVFKFVAVRPPQRVSDKETSHTIIRDARASDPAGVRTLAAFAGDLARPEAALARWRELDTSALTLLFEAHRVLLTGYEALREKDAPPDARDLLQKAGAAKVVADPKVLNLAWEALYVADSTGPDAGPRLETPIAALRVLHFAELAREQKNPSRSAALDALLATPALPRSFHEARVPPAAAPVAGGPPLATNAYPGASDRSAQLRALAQELVSTERLLGLVSEVPAAAGSALHTGSAVQQDGWRRSGFSVQAASTLRTAFAGRLSGDEASLLDRLRLPQTAAVPAAAQTLQAHLSTLSGQALALGTDREFQGYMRDLTTPLSVASAREAGILNPDWGGLHVINDDGEFAKDVSVAGRIKPLGIGDLKVVKQTLLAYVPGEVANIENVLKGESKERKHRKLDRTETTLFTSEEETKDTERDTQTTDRFELKREA